MEHTELSGTYDKAGIRGWITYEFWKPADFARNNDLSERTVRHLCKSGMPFHGRPHKGKGGMLFSKSAIRWLVQYRNATGNGRYRFGGMNKAFLDDLECDILDERQAFARLYGVPIPADKWLASPEHADERRSWEKFKAAKPTGRTAS